ncbi:MAG: 30S ribosomal protein S3 [archaeon]
MIERKFVAQRVKEYQIQEYVSHSISRVGHSSTKFQRTPLGEKIVITAQRPGLVVGKGGSNISKLTKKLKELFNLENPQIELNEVMQPFLDASIVAESIANSLERFGTQQFKGIGHKVMSSVMLSGALGVEILISGKIPSSRAKTWRFYAGYLKNCGDIAVSGVHKAYAVAKLKSGVVGIQVKIMPPTTILPDKIVVLDVMEQQAGPVKEEPELEKVKDAVEKVMEMKPRRKKTETKPRRKKKSEEHA